MQNSATPGQDPRIPDPRAQELAHAAADEMRSSDAMLDTIPIPEITPSAMERFIGKITFPEDPAGCWVWAASRNAAGYGRYSIAGIGYRAHRVSWAWRNGPIPRGLSMDHICRNRACVNPDHLEPKTQRDNTLAGHTLAAVNLSREFCTRGHELVAINLVPAVLRRGERGCRICVVIRNRARNVARLAGASPDEITTAGCAAVEALSGDETIESLGLGPYPIHYALGLVESQRPLDLEIVRSP